MQATVRWKIQTPKVQEVVAAKFAALQVPRQASRRAMKPSLEAGVVSWARQADSNIAVKQR